MSSCAGRMALAVAAAVFVWGVGSVAVSAAQSVELNQFGGSFANPFYVTGDPTDPSRVFVVEEAGTIRTVENGVTQATPFLDINEDVLDRSEPSNCECGLLSVAFPPDYAASGKFYVLYTRDSEVPEEHHYIRLEEFERSATNPEVADPSTGRVVLEIANLFGIPNHNAGQIHFGRDGLLYMSVGDGAGVDGRENGQSISTLLGKLLRIDPEGSMPNEYTVPPSNPFVGVAGEDEIYSYGLRNPWRFSFDRATGDLTIGDVGGERREEVDFVARGDGLGANFGWDCFEGTLAFNTTGPCDPPPANHTPPVLEYAHPPGARAAVVGGYVIRDGALPSLLGRYVYTDSFSSDFRTARLFPGGHTEDQSLGLDPVDFPVSFGEDACAHIYVAAIGAGLVYRLEPESGPFPCSPQAGLPPQASLPSPPQASLLRCRGKRSTLVGTPGRDVLRGTARKDVIAGLGGPDRIKGLGKADRLCGGKGRDKLIGGRGKDRLFGKGGADRLFGQGGNDRLVGGRRSDRCNGGKGRDRAKGCEREKRI